MGIMKLFKGKDIDMSDPRYQEMQKEYREKGAAFSKAMRIDRAIGWLQRLGEAHKKAFLLTVFAIVLGCFFLNVYRIVRSYRQSGNEQQAVTYEQIDRAMKDPLK